jgi:outer membrane protein assembly factor BamE (lipoprotein component of BamABCDE complex)
MRLLILALALLSAPACTVQVVTTQSATKATKVYTREEFKKLLLGKSKQEVKDLLGKPDNTTEGGGKENWSYYRRTKDPDSGKVDKSVLISFEGGKVAGFIF